MAANFRAGPGLAQRLPMRGMRPGGRLKRVRSDDYGTKSFEAGPSLRGSLEERALGSTMTSLFVIGDLSCSEFLNCFLAFLIKPGF